MKNKINRQKDKYINELENIIPRNKKRRIKYYGFIHKNNNELLVTPKHFLMSHYNLSGSCNTFEICSNQM